MEPRWINWARRIQAIAHIGLTYSTNPFDRERYRFLQNLALEMLEAHVELASEEDRVRLEELFTLGEGYPTPRVDVRAAVFGGDRVLLVRERADGRWSLPGGWADVGSSPTEMAVREVAEEAGLQVRPMRLLAIWDNARHHNRPVPFAIYKICIACEPVGGRAESGIETDGVGWFSVHALPPLSVSRITPGQLERLYHLYTHPELAPEVD